MEENPDDPCDTLGVQRGATPERIKEAYDDKVRLHSDKDGGNLDQADEAMKAVTAADSILEDPEKGAEYDLSLGGGAGAAVSRKGSVQASSSRGECLTEREKDGATNEAGSLAASEEAVGEGPDSQDVAVGNEETAAVVEIEAEIEDEASGVDRAGKELLHSKGVATSISTSDEIQPETDVSGHASTSSPAVVESAAGKLWRDAIEEKNPVELLRLLKADASNFWKHEREGRTALHIAAMGGTGKNLELAKLILDELLKVRRRNYTQELKKEFGNFSVNVRDYIEGVERESGKTAMKLAEENSERSATGKAICEHITVTLNLNEEHIGIDLAVQTQERGNWNYRRISSSLSLSLPSQSCNLLLKYFEENPSSDMWWKYKDEFGRTRTVLHVAATQGCFRLAQKMLDIARDRDDREYIEAVDPQSNLTALQMADDIIGNRSIAEYIKFTLERMKNGEYEHPGFFEAYPNTLWRSALATGDCDRLKHLVSANPGLLLETYKGLTVLHVAIICRSLDLVKAVLKVFDPLGWKGAYGPSNYPPSPTWKQMFEKKAHFDGDVFVDVRRSKPHLILRDDWKSISEFEFVLCDRKPFEGSVEELVNFMQQHKLFESDSKMVQLLKDYDQTGVLGSSSDDLQSFYARNFSKLENLVKKGWQEEWNEGYEADVDFNFEEPRLTWLRIHYACKYPLTFKEYLRSVIPAAALQRRPTRFAIPLHDAQGRTFYHVLVDHRNNEDHFPGRWILKEVNGDPLSLYYQHSRDARDARGRTINDVRLTKNYLQSNIFLSNKGELHYDYLERRFGYGASKKGGDGKRLEDEIRVHYSKYDPMDNDDYATCFGAYLMARALKQTNVAQDIWFGILEKNIKNFPIKDLFKHILFFAASTGDQEVLRVLLEDKGVCLITDENGRSALHHAANASLFELANLLDYPRIGHCFSTVNDYREVQRKWNFERKQMIVIHPQRSEEKDSDVEKLVNAGRSANILMLLQGGVDLSQEDNDKKVPNIGPTNDAEYQTWWYTTVVKDATDKKNSFNQAASAISVVGTLVAATSYIGPLQPPMTYNDNGYVRLGEKLVEVFMVSNTLAFYLAMTSVMFAVVPALPMPQESVLSELKRAQHTVAFSLSLLLSSIVFIIISFAVASMVVIQDHESFNGAGLLTFPSIIGWIFGLIGIVSFLIRMMRLMFYDNSIIRRIYQFSFIDYIKDTVQACYARMFCKRNHEG